jgi:hypothetical protein
VLTTILHQQHAVGRFLENLVKPQLRTTFYPRSVLRTSGRGWKCMLQDYAVGRRDGSLYDCDFNQALGLPLYKAASAINGFDYERRSNEG